MWETVLEGRSSSLPATTNKKEVKLNKTLLSKVLAEEKRGREKWGSTDNSPEILLSAAIEELGEVAHEINHNGSKIATQQEIAEVIGVLSRLWDMVSSSPGS